MTVWIMGIYFVGFGLCFLFLLIMAGIGNSPGLGSSLGSEAVTFVMLGSFLWPLLLVISIVAGIVVGIKGLTRKEKNGLRNTT
ncbi:membrane protein [Streptomyces phage Patelgo]|nr:membrane protein [Streptomyces phage Patelgo]